ncbi:hypothetical protein LguiA_006896 [Lonicera macranthoides]
MPDRYVEFEYRFGAKVSKVFAPLDRVNLLNGTIPEFITNLSELTQLELGFNPYFPGPLPSNLGCFIKLQYLWIANSNLTGSIPYSMGNLVQLKNLDLSNNCLIGSIPINIGRLKKCRTD